MKNQAKLEEKASRAAVKSSFRSSEKSHSNNLVNSARELGKGSFIACLSDAIQESIARSRRYRDRCLIRPVRDA
jgi:hypothetical protein